MNLYSKTERLTEKLHYPDQCKTENQFKWNGKRNHKTLNVCSCSCPIQPVVAKLKEHILLMECSLSWKKKINQAFNILFTLGASQGIGIGCAWQGHWCTLATLIWKLHKHHKTHSTQHIKVIVTQQQKEWWKRLWASEKNH